MRAALLLHLGEMAAIRQRCSPEQELSLGVSKRENARIPRRRGSSLLHARYSELSLDTIR